MGRMYREPAKDMQWFVMEDILMRINDDVGVRYSNSGWRFRTKKIRALRSSRLHVVNLITTLAFTWTSVAMRLHKRSVGSVAFV